ncbi:insulin-degrading enzyme-like 1, peroxisomal [Fagus crenata]
MVPYVNVLYDNDKQMNGGFTNAFTDSENTNYYFDVDANCFEEASDRFAQFFIKPLMSADATMREIKAVDSEYQRNFLSDCWRMNQLQKHLSREDHPYHKFSTGNSDTLEVRPKAKGLDTRLELIKFYEENYSANLMHLVIYAKETLNKIQSMVEEKFQDIRNTNRSCFYFPGQPCTLEHLQILVKAVPIQPVHKLSILWPITLGIKHYKEGPCKYLCYLIGHEGEGSLFFILKTFGWATDLCVGVAKETLEYSFFKVVIDLTDAGHVHMQDIIGLLFKYIDLLKQSGIPKWIFDELSGVCERKFHYRDKIRPIEYVVYVASNMKRHPPKDWLVGSSLPSVFNPSIIQMVLEELSIDNIQIFWESKNFEGATENVEPWYGTKYSIQKITHAMIQEWKLCAPNANLHLPESNKFIPTDLSLKSAQENVKFPVLLKNSSYSRSWYKPDTMFSTPKAYVKIYFNCPHSGNSPKEEVLTEIFRHLLMDCLNEYGYYARVAGLDYDISHANCGFQVTLLGYNHKLRILLEHVTEKIVSFEVKPDRFSVIKEMVTKDYQNFKFQKPYEQALDYCSLILHHHMWSWMEKHGILPHLEAKDLAEFVPVMLSKAFLECYIAGNIETSEAKSMIQHIEDVFFSGPNPLSQALSPSEHVTNGVVKLERGMSYFYPAVGLNPNDENSALVHYIQVHRDDVVLNVKLKLFVRIAKQPAFHQLRSVEQLGYTTKLTERNDSGIRGLQFYIQSTVKGPGNIDLRVQEFLKKFGNTYESKLCEFINESKSNVKALREESEWPEHSDGTLEFVRKESWSPGKIDSRVEAFLRILESKLSEMTSEEFQRNVNELIEMMLDEKHKNLREESEFYWKEIYDGTKKFDRKESQVAALKELTKQEFIDFFNDYIKVGAPERKTLSIGVYGKLHSAEYTTEKSDPVLPYSVKIDDIISFKNSQPLYPSFRGVSDHGSHR